jgi:hypothetical protein
MTTVARSKNCWAKAEDVALKHWRIRTFSRGHWLGCSESVVDRTDLQGAAVLGWTCFRFIIFLAACMWVTALPAEEKKPKGQHDMLLLLPDGPAHLRVHITDNGNPLQDTRQQYIQRLIVKLDTDQDGKVSRSETMKPPLFTCGRRFEGNKFLKTLQWESSGGTWSIGPRKVHQQVAVVWLLNRINDSTDLVNHFQY